MLNQSAKRKVNFYYQKLFYVLVATIIIFTKGFPAPSIAAALLIKETKDIITISSGDKPMLEYIQTSNPNKVYVSKLFTPSGMQILLDSPHDHIHHHGLMYALDSGKNITWWLDGKKMGKQVPVGKTETKKEKRSAAIKQALSWNTADGTAILKEARTISVHKGTDIPATLLTWNTVLSVAGKDPVPLATKKHYAGLGIRFVLKMDKIGLFIFPDGKNSTAVRGTENVTPDTWCAYRTAIDDKPVTVAMFSAPSNFRHPTYWFTMTAPFAYISATLNLYRDPYTLKPGFDLDLTYGVAVFNGKQDKSAIEKLYQAWLKLLPEK